MQPVSWRGSRPIFVAIFACSLGVLAALSYLPGVSGLGLDPVFSAGLLGIAALAVFFAAAVMERPPGARVALLVLFCVSIVVFLAGAIVHPSDAVRWFIVATEAISALSLWGMGARRGHGEPAGDLAAAEKEHVS